MNAAIEHPAPHRGRAGKARTVLSLAGAPAAWVAQMSFSEPLAAYACYPHRMPLTTPLWHLLPEILAAISLVCMVAAIFSTCVAWHLWRSTRDELPGDAMQAMQTGAGRTRFLALVGMLASGLFTGAILLTSCALLLVTPCGA